MGKNDGKNPFFGRKFMEKVPFSYGNKILYY